MKHRNTIPINVKYNTDEIVTATHETAVAQMIQHSIEVLKRRIGDIHNIESEYPTNIDPKFITDVARSIGTMSNIVPPLNKAKLLAYTPFLYNNLKDATYNVIPHPDQTTKCSVGCIFDRYNPLTFEMECAEKMTSYYRQSSNSDIICSNTNCPKWSGNPIDVRDIEDLPDTTTTDKLRRYKIVFPTEERLIPYAAVKYYENCGTDFGEPHRVDTQRFDEGDALLDPSDPYNPRKSYAYHDLHMSSLESRKAVEYLFEDLKPENDSKYYLVIELPNLGAKVAVYVSPNDTTWYELPNSPYTTSDYVLDEYEINKNYYKDTGSLYVKFEPVGVIPNKITDDDYEMIYGTTVSHLGILKQYMGATCNPNYYFPSCEDCGASNLLYIDGGNCDNDGNTIVGSNHQFVLTNYQTLVDGSGNDISVRLLHPKFSYDTNGRIAFFANFSSWNGLRDTVYGYQIWIADLTRVYSQSSSISDNNGVYISNVTVDSSSVQRVTNSTVYDASYPAWVPNCNEKFISYTCQLSWQHSSLRLVDISNSSYPTQDITSGYDNEHFINSSLVERCADVNSVWHPTSVDENGKPNKLLFTRMAVVYEDRGSGSKWYLDPSRYCQICEATITWSGWNISSVTVTQKTTIDAVNEWADYSPDGEWIVFHSNRENRTASWQIVSHVAEIHDIYMIKADVSETDSSGSNPAIRISDDTWGDCEAPVFNRDGTALIMQGNQCETWDSDGDGIDDRQRYNFFEVSLIEDTGGYVSQLWLVEVTNKRHDNFGEKLLLPKYLDRVTPFNEYPKGSMFLYDTFESTTLDHIRFYSSYFKYFDDNTLVHRDCVDVFVYNDQALSVGNNRYLLYTTGTSLADLAGGLLDDFINHVSNPDMHLSEKDVCELINNPTLCCQYETTDATVEFQNTVGVKIGGSFTEATTDNFEVGKPYSISMIPFGEAVPEEVVYYWELVSPSGKFYINKSKYFINVFDEVGTWLITAQLRVKVGNELINIGATDQISVYMKPSSNPVRIASARTSCFSTDNSCCYNAGNGGTYTLIWFKNYESGEPVNCGRIPDNLQTQATGNMKTIIKINGKYAPSGGAIKRSGLIYTKSSTGTKIPLRYLDFVTYTVADEIIDTISITGDTTSNIGKYDGWTLGCAAYDNNSRLYFEFTYKAYDSDGNFSGESETVELMFPIGVQATAGYLPTTSRRIQSWGARRCEYSSGSVHTYQDVAGSNLNTYYAGMYLDSESSTYQSVLYNGLIYAPLNTINMEHVGIPIIHFNVGNLFDVPPDDIHSIILLVQIVEISNGIDGTRNWTKTLSSTQKKLKFDLFDYGVIELRQNELYHGLTPHTPYSQDGYVVGIDNIIYNGKSYSTYGCSVCHTLLTIDDGIPDPVRWVINDPDLLHTRSFNLVQIRAGNGGCGPFDLCCLGSNETEMYKRGGGAYSLVTGRPVRNTTDYSKDEPQYGKKPMDGGRTWYFLSKQDLYTTEISTSIDDGCLQPSIVECDLTDEIKTMITEYNKFPTLYQKPSRLALRFHNIFPYNNNSKENRYVGIGVETRNDDTHKPSLTVLFGDWS